MWEGEAHDLGVGEVFEVGLHSGRVGDGAVVVEGVSVEVDLFCSWCDLVGAELAEDV